MIFSAIKNTFRIRRSWQRIFVVSVVFSFITGIFNLRGQCSILKDINPGPGDGIASNFAGKIVVDGIMYFGADDGVHGTELWRTDGTDSGTWMIRDIHPGPESSFSKLFFDLGQTIVFVADDGETGFELWRTDGTAEGTVLVKDVWPGTQDGLTIHNDFFYDDYFELLDSVLIFRGLYNLWRTDGTTDGTYQIRDINGSMVSYPTNMVKFQEKVYFSANSPFGVGGLWCTDGTYDGTIYVAPEGYFRAFSLSPHGDLLYFNGASYAVSNPGSEPWISDGTAEGTMRLKDINPGPERSVMGGGVNAFISTHQWVLFSADDGTRGFALWRTDGTTAGTTFLKDFSPVNATFQEPRDFFAFQGLVYCLVDDNIHGREIWRTDGEVATTVLVKDINPGAAHGFYGNFYPYAHLDKMYFAAQTDDAGEELWESDGTESGTRMLMDIDPDSSSYPDNFISLGNVLLFSARTDETGIEYFRFDPTIPELTVRDSLVPPGCNGALEGEIHLEIEGGIPPYEIQLSGQGVSGTAFVGLAGGSHELFVRDSFGFCMRSTLLLEEPQKLTVSTHIRHEINHQSDGAITIEPTGGTPPYTFQWSHTDTLSTHTASALQAGLYRCTVTDFNACQAIAFAVLKDEKNIGGVETDDHQAPVIITSPLWEDEVIIRSANGFPAGASYTMYHLTGQIVATGKTGNENEISIDLSEMVSGMYIIHIDLGNGEFVAHKIVR